MRVAQASKPYPATPRAKPDRSIDPSSGAARHLLPQGEKGQVFPLIVTLSFPALTPQTLGLQEMKGSLRAGRVRFQR
jgi:hypothetical protein